MAEEKPVTLSKAGNAVGSHEPLTSHALIEARLKKLPRDVGWMMFGVGFAGFVAPGVLGLPFMVAGGMILWPKTTHRLQRLLGVNPAGKKADAGMKQIVRFIDDLEKRYPAGGKP